MNAIQLAISKVGTISDFARALDVTPQAVCFWRDGKRRVPADKCPDIERLSGIRCEDLRGDVDWKFIRGTSVTTEPEAAAAAGQGAI
jgi:DNA-binding transcriptional regulator YdaS (Cro superfamily)